MREMRELSFNSNLSQWEGENQQLFWTKSSFFQLVFLTLYFIIDAGIIHVSLPLGEQCVMYGIEHLRHITNGNQWFCLLSYFACLQRFSEELIIGADNCYQAHNILTQAL